MGEGQSALTVLVAGEEDEGMRLDVFLTGRYEGQSRSQIKKLFQDPGVTLNGKKAKGGDLIRQGDEVAFLAFGEAEPARLKPTAMALDVLYEDEALLVINKPKGLVVHPGAGTTEATLVEGILFHLGIREEQNAASPEALRPGIVHRLDKDTSGVLVCAKNPIVQRELARQFQDKTNLREYVALLDGTLVHEETIIDNHLTRDPRERTRYVAVPNEVVREKAAAGEDTSGYRWAKSVFFRQIVYSDRLTLARVRLFTGRTHQIRAHARFLGVPVVGDPLYHPQQLQLPPGFPKAVAAKLMSVQTQLLHARILGFVHPLSGRKLAFEAPLPQEFREVLQLLNENSR